MSEPRRIAYLVSRFPAVSETFVVRELNEVAADPGIEPELLSLFPSREERSHRSGERWVDALRRPGPGKSALGLAWWLARRPLRLARCAVEIVADSWRRPRILVRSLVTLPIAAAHARGARERGVEHVHAHFANYPALAAWLIHRLAGIPYSFTAHAHDIFVDQGGLPRRIREARFVATISEFNARFLARFNPADTPIEVIHCGIDPALYPHRARRPPASGPVRALCVASLQEKKGHRVLFEALAGEPRLARVELDLVGGGPLRESLEQLADELGLASRVRFHGPLDESEVRALLEAADLFVLPSIIASDGQMEGIPVALMEAVASGLYVVGTRMSGIPELIADDRIGLLSEPGNAAELRAALVSALDADPPPAAGRGLIEAEFSVPRSGERMSALLGGAGAQGSRPASSSNST